jgi:DNA-binding transcriptional ArsR family regulator
VWTSEPPIRLSSTRNPGDLGNPGNFGILYFIKSQDYHPLVPRTSGLRRAVAPGVGQRDAARPASGVVLPPADHLDRLIHERLRLAIVSALAANAALTFTELKRLLKTTDGNLSVHARKLEEAGYISCVKSFEGRTPRSEFTLTPAGRVALNRYLDHMEALIRAARTLTT